MEYTPDYLDLRLAVIDTPTVEYAGHAVLYDGAQLRISNRAHQVLVTVAIESVTYDGVEWVFVTDEGETWTVTKKTSGCQCGKDVVRVKAI